MKRLKYAFLVIIGMISINAFAGTFYSGFGNGIYTPAPDAKYTYDANASYGLINGTYWADWNNMRYICTNQQKPVIKEWSSNSSGYYQEWIWPDGWYFWTTWSAQQAADLRYDKFYAHPPGETNVFSCVNTEQGLSNAAYHYVSVGGDLYYCTAYLNTSRLILDKSSCNGTTCKMLDRLFNTFKPWCGVVKPPVPEPVIVNNPCPKYQSNSSGAVRNADSTFIKANNLCAEQVKIGFDGEGNAKSVLIEQYNQVASTVASTGLGAILRSGGADSTNIGGGLPNTVNYSDFTLGKNANGQTQIQGASTGTATVR